MAEPDVTGSSSAPGVTSDSPTETPSSVTDSPAEALNTEKSLPEKVPYERVQEAALGRQRAERETDRIRAELDALKGERDADLPKPGEVTRGEAQDILAAMPANLTDEADRTQWLIQNMSVPHIEKIMGVKLEHVGQLLRAGKQGAESSARNEWYRECSNRGIDPENRKAQTMVMGLINGPMKMSEADAFAEVQDVYGGKGNGNTATVETASVAGPTIAAQDVRVRDKVHANELAQKGVQVAYRSLSDVLADKIRSTK